MAKIEPTNIKSFATTECFYSWLEENHLQVSELWLRIYKKGSGYPSINWQESVQVALCWGWIDGLKKSLDDDSYLQRFTPRKAKSVWSKRNTEYVEQLIATGLMQEAGMIPVRLAKADGRWDAAYAISAEMEFPDDFVKALAAKPQAQAFFDALSKSNKHIIYHALSSAKKPQTRERRLSKYLLMLDNRQKPS